MCTCVPLIFMLKNCSELLVFLQPQSRIYPLTGKKKYHTEDLATGGSSVSLYRVFYSGTTSCPYTQFTGEKQVSKHNSQGKNKFPRDFGYVF